MSMDWPTTVDTFRHRFMDRFTTQRMNLRGSNMMTPDYLGTVRDGNGDPVEVTTGIGMRGERIFGVTWNRLPDGSMDGSADPRDRCCFSLDEVEAALNRTIDADGVCRPCREGDHDECEQDCMCIDMEHDEDDD